MMKRLSVHKMTTEKWLQKCGKDTKYKGKFSWTFRVSFITAGVLFLVMGLTHFNWSCCDQEHKHSWFNDELLCVIYEAVAGY